MNAHGAVLLDRHRRPRHSLTILVPRGYEDIEGPVLIGVCHVCQMLGRETRFYAGEEQAWQRHVGRCARANLEEIRARAPRERQRGTPFDPDVWDPEEEAHMLRVGQRMLAEGRMELRRNERAGAGGGGVL